MSAWRASPIGIAPSVFWSMPCTPSWAPPDYRSSRRSPGGRWEIHLIIATTGKNLAYSTEIYEEFNPKTAGGGGGGGWINPPSTFSATIPPREIFWPRSSLTFYFQVLRILWHHFRENRAYRYDAAQPFIQARQTKNGSKTWFCVQSQCKWSFLTLFIKLWLFSLSLAEINSF